MPRYVTEATDFSVALSSTEQIYTPHQSLVSVDVQNQEASLVMALHFTNNPWSLSFDGTNDVVDINAAATDMATAVTGSIKAGIRVDTGSSARQTIYSLSDANTETALWFEVDAANKLSASLVVGGTVAWTVTTDQAIALGSWQEVKIVHNGTEATLYANEEAPAQTFSVSTTKASWFSALTGIDTANIGALDYNSAADANFFKGDIDYLFVVDGLGTRAKPGTKSFHVRLEEGASTTATDLSANANNGTISGATWATRGPGIELAADSGRVFHIKDDPDIRNGLWITNADGSAPTAGVYKIALDANAR